MKHAGYAIYRTDGTFYTGATGEGISFCPNHFETFTVFHIKELAEELCERFKKTYNLDLKVVQIYAVVEERLYRFMR